MAIFGAIVLSFLITLGFYMFDKSQYKWWEFFLAPIATGAVVLLFIFMFDSLGQSYTETWGSSVVAVYEEEPYNEWHHETCYYYTTDSKGNTTSHSYDCSHQDDHGPSWYAVTDINETINISEEQHDKLVSQFGTRKTAVDKRENYDDDDLCRYSSGSKFAGRVVGEYSYIYRTSWPGTDNTRKAVSTQHNYTNKVKASDLTIFNISLVDEKLADSLKLFKYPELKDELEYPTVLGVNLPYETHEKFKRLNGKFGPTNQVRVWILVYENRPTIIGNYQENYWVRGNMNELVICIGKKDTTIQWSNVFSWTTNGTLPVKIRDYITNMKSFTPEHLDGLYEYLNLNLKEYKRRDFKEFDYLKRETKWWEILIAYIFGIAAAVGVNYWAATNEFNDNENRSFYNKNRYRY